MHSPMQICRYLQPSQSLLLSQNQSNNGCSCRDFSRAFNKMTEESQKDLFSSQINIKRIMHLAISIHDVLVIKILISVFILSDEYID